MDLPLLPERHVVGPGTMGGRCGEVQPGVRWSSMARASRCRAVARLTTLVRGVPAFMQRAVEPVAGVFALQGGADVAVVLQVVADDERGAVLAAAAAADALAGAEGFDGDAVAEDDRVAAPDRAAADGVGEVLGEAAVVEQFGLEVFEVGAGLVLGVGDDPDVGFAAFEGRAERQGEGGDGRFGAAAGAEDVELGAARGACGVELVGQPVVHVRRRAAEVVGEIFAAPGEEIDGACVRARGGGLFRAAATWPFQLGR